MSEYFEQIKAVYSSNEVFVSSSALVDVRHPILISDCYHAEVQSIAALEPMNKGYLIKLAKPLAFSYEKPVYLGQWLEEQWFIKKNARGTNTLHYALFQTEEFSPLIHDLSARMLSLEEKQMIKIDLGLSSGAKHSLLVAVRGQ